MFEKKKVKWFLYGMKICVAGLGLIGGSLCMALRRAGYKADGYNRSPAPLEYALRNNIIAAPAAGFEEYDVVFVALPPRAAVQFINANVFKDGAIVADICGVKGYMEREIYSRPRNFLYVGTHPMAGKEVSGIQNACVDLFDRASMVITSCPKTDAAALLTIKKLTKEMGFRVIVECSAEVHDRKIAYTSQLAHVVSNAYVKDGEIESCLGFTGGSFQDMTRIAGVDEGVWSELYLLNSANLSARIGELIANLSQIKSAIDGADEEVLRGVLKEGREMFSGQREKASDDGIKITLLK